MVNERVNGCFGELNGVTVLIEQFNLGFELVGVAELVQQFRGGSINNSVTRMV